MNKISQESQQKELRIKICLITIVFCFAVFYFFWPSEIGWKHSLNDFGYKAKRETKATWRIIKNKFIARKVILGVTTRREFEELFNAKLAGGISNQFCSSNLYCQDSGVLLKVKFDEKDDKSPWNCNPDAKIIAPIVNKRGFCATD